jgi:hypothetical protein
VQDFRDLIRYMMAHPFLTNVALAGPEAGSGIDPSHPLSSPGIKWSRPLVGSPGRIPLPQAKTPTSINVAAEVTAPSSLRTRLQLGAGHAVKVWLNGKMIYDGQPGQGPAQPDQAGVDVTLNEGSNQLLLQITYQGENEAIYARFLDPDRKLRYGDAK